MRAQSFRPVADYLESRALPNSFMQSLALPIRPFALNLDLFSDNAIRPGQPVSDGPLALRVVGLPSGALESGDPLLDSWGDGRYLTEQYPGASYKVKIAGQDYLMFGKLQQEQAYVVDGQNWITRAAPARPQAPSQCMSSQFLHGTNFRIPVMDVYLKRSFPE
jgi:hypothetical protein